MQILDSLPITELMCLVSDWPFSAMWTYIDDYCSSRESPAVFTAMDLVTE